MSIVIHCKDLAFDCDHVIQAETEEDALSLVVEHAKAEHDIEEVTPEMLDLVKAVIREGTAES